MTDRYERLFERLSQRHEAALIPFLMAGDPDPDAFLACVDSVIAAGADALELGIPFSDPVADGPTVVAASRRALSVPVNTDTCLEMIHAIRRRHPDTPIGLLVYANLVFSRGVQPFHDDVARVGVDSILVPDLPLRESLPFRQAAAQAGIHPVFILPDNADAETLLAVSKASRGYTYLLGRAGVSGAERAVEVPLPGRIAALRAKGAPPAVIGFGVSTPRHVRDAVASGAAGVIVGSALIDAMEHGNDPFELLQSMKRATRLPHGTRG